MARKKTTNAALQTTDFRHESAKRTNIPPAKIAGEGTVPDIGKKKYAYSPHLSPILRLDLEGRADKVHEALEKACAGRSLNLEEKEILRAVGANWQNPWLEWAGKKEEHDRRWRTVDPVALHIHERVSANAILSAAKRKNAQRSLFADPEMEYQEAVQFYSHDMDWANRLVLGDSLQVMSSLARREDLTGKVQMIYIDPPYGIKFARNFQPQVGKFPDTGRDREQDLTREAEMVKAYRDTWNLGVHSYLSYLRDRLILAKELLAETGSMFLQIGDENVHRVRCVLDEVFGAQNFMSSIVFQTTSASASGKLDSVADVLLWYARDRSTVKYRQLYEAKSPDTNLPSAYNRIKFQSGASRGATRLEKDGALDSGARLYALGDLTSARPAGEGDLKSFVFEGRRFNPGKGTFKSDEAGLQRLAMAERIQSTDKRIGYVRYVDDFPAMPLANVWTDVSSSFMADKVYAVQTNRKVIERCLLMTTDPGDLVVDPTCGGGTTAYVAERLGRRWITIDTSRVAIALTRQRVLTAKFDHYQLAGEKSDETASRNGKGVDPSANFSYKTVPHITLGSIARDENLDPIFANYESILNEKLAALNRTLDDLTDPVREKLVGKLATKMQDDGVRSATDADCRRWLLPGTTKKHIELAFAGQSKLTTKRVKEHAEMVPPDDRFEHWHVPFDMDPDWPVALANAVAAYRKAWRAKMNEVNVCIVANAEQEVLVDQPAVVKGVVRVTGPFTVEGVMPEELNVGEEGLFDGTPNEELEYGEIENHGRVEVQNVHAYLSSMVSHLKSDGVTFPDNKNPKFARLEPLFDAESGSSLHAEGVWEAGDADGPSRVGVGFGPQYGPVTARQLEELIREANRRGYDDLVVAGFSFDAEAHSITQEAGHPKLRIHIAQIRPDLNAGMEGLLKDTPDSQLFTVFGTPAIHLKKDGDEYTVTLEGVDIFDPVKNTVQSTGAAKVAAWFLDSDYDGRCFCITQAFFPDQEAWEKLAKALKNAVGPESFAAFKGTESLPFNTGEYHRVAVKVIDPRGNEVMTVHKLEA